MIAPGLTVHFRGLLLLQVALVTARQHLVGDIKVWDSIFDSRFAAEVVTIPGDAWPEGPQEWEDSVIFSDTIKNRIFRYHRHRGITVLRLGSGGAAVSDLEWMAEPGSNGIVIDPHRDNTAYICQHGAHAVSKMDLLTGEITVLASRFRGRRLNGPNDIVLDEGGDYLYFTDPVYAYLEQERFYDAAYLDEACQENLGYKGIYRLRVDGGEDSLQLLDAHRLQRPNGIAFSPDYSHLYVSECCQGSHLSNCTQGTSRYFVYSVLGDGLLEYKHVVEFHDDSYAGASGCADGFKVHPSTGLIVGSCPMGICIVRPGVSGTEARPSQLLPPAQPKPLPAKAEALNTERPLVLSSATEDDAVPGGFLASADHSAAGKKEEEEEGRPAAQKTERTTMDPHAVGEEEDAPQQEMVTSGGSDRQEGIGLDQDGGTSQSVPTDESDAPAATADAAGFATSEAMARLDAEASRASGSAESPGGTSGEKKRGMRIKVLPDTNGAPPSKATAFEILEGKPQGTYASRRLLAFRSTSEHKEPLHSESGLVAKLYLAHKTSNVLFSSDGYMYATGEAPHGGGGALLKIPLRQQQHGREDLDQTNGLHDELRHR